ncbi:hypothetical protein LUZ60_014586 [Juncus effusus]|nr:hypothetical protein LUZ60_014586 [Juncus effusus]
MASLWSFFGNQDNQQSEQEKEEEQEAYKKYEDIASRLPVQQTIFAPLRQYKGSWYPGEFAATTIAIEDTFKAQETDVILTTYPKSGTTWIKALIFTIMNREMYSFDKHPLLDYSPHDCFPFLHTLYEGKSVPKKFLESMPNPRLLATHIPFLTLPSSVSESGCRIIYLCREPKDALVSMGHYMSKIFPDFDVLASVKSMVKMACDGTFHFVSVWDHMLGYWNESLKRPDKVLFLKYEDLHEDTGGNVRRLATFLGRPFNDKEEREGIVGKIMEFCCLEEMKCREVNKTGRHGGDVNFENSAFFRKGAIGDWKEHIPLELAQRFDTVMEEKLRGSGLSFSK